MNSLYKWQIYAVLIAAFTQGQGNYKPTRGNYTLCRLYSCPVFLCRFIFLYREINRIVILLAGK